MADYYAKKYDYIEAKALYNRLIQLYPQDDYAIQAGLKRVKVDILAKIETGSVTVASNEVEQLIANHSENPYFLITIYDIAGGYAKRRYLDKAKVLYQRVIDSCSQDSYIDKTRFEQIKINVLSKFEIGDFTAVDGLLKDAAANYPSHKILPEVLFFAADKYMENYKYQEAKALYNKILAISPDSSSASKSKLELVRIDVFEKISKSDFISAENLTKKLISENTGDSYLPEVIYAIAFRYVKCCNHEHAKKLYSQLIELYPENPYSSRARIAIEAIDIKSKIAMGAFESALKEFEHFINKYEKTSNFARECYDLADYCCIKIHSYKTAISMFESVLSRFSHCYYYYVRAKMGCDAAKVCREIEEGNLSEAQQALQSFKQNYADHYYLPSQLYFIATIYSELGHPEQADAICDDVINKGGSRYAVYCSYYKNRLPIYSRLKEGNLAGAKQLVNQFKSNHQSTPCIEEGLLTLVQEFYQKGLRTEGDSSKDYLQEAIAICQAEKLAESDVADFKAQTYSMLGQSYFKLGDFSKSAYYHQKIVDEYPDSAYAWNAQFMVGRAYEDMLKAGLISELEARPLIASAYKKVLNKYPGCPASGAARIRLTKSSDYAIVEANEVKANDSNGVN
jgi:TolA-binding protein